MATWNVLNRIDDGERVLEFVRSSDADVIAFQELTDSHVASLRSLTSYTLHTAEDFWEGDQITYLGVLTRLPVTTIRRHRLNAVRALSPSTLGRYMKWIESVDGLCVTLALAGKQWQFTNVHLPCATSATRRRSYLDEVLRVFRPTGNEVSVVLGDFNCFARPWLNWFAALPLGLPAREMLLHELRDLDTYMSACGYATRQHAHTSATYPLVLDRIFAKGARLEQMSVLSNSYGSDHRPIVAYLDLVS